MRMSFSICLKRVLLALVPILFVVEPMCEHGNRFGLLLRTWSVQRWMFSGSLERVLLRLVEGGVEVDLVLVLVDQVERRLNGLHVPTPYSAPLEAAVAPKKEEKTFKIIKLYLNIKRLFIFYILRKL